MSGKTSDRRQPTTRATDLGKSDGAVQATIKPDNFDPPGGFIRQVAARQLAEPDRTEYVTAFKAEFLATLKVIHPQMGR